MAKKSATLSEYLDTSRQESLIKSARDKISEGKSPSLAEVQALKKLEKSETKKKLSSLPPVPKGLYLELYGGDSTTYCNWRKKHRFPWTEDSDFVDINEILNWYRGRVVALHRSEKMGIPEHASVARSANARRQEAQARKSEIEVQVLEGKLILIDDILSDIAMFGAHIRDGIETVAKINSEAAQIMTDKVHDAWVEFESTHGKTEPRKGTRRKGKRKTKSVRKVRKRKPAKKAARVR